MGFIIKKKKTTLKYHTYPMNRSTLLKSTFFFFQLRSRLETLDWLSFSEIVYFLTLCWGSFSSGLGVGGLRGGVLKMGESW